MKKFIMSTMAATAAVAMVPSTASAATIINAGFETGDLTGWSVNAPAAGLVSVVSSATALGAGPTYLPQEGNFFAKLLTGTGQDLSTVLSQTFDMLAGETFSFRTAFDTSEAPGSSFNDKGSVGVFNITDAINTTLYSKSVSSVVPSGSEPWTYITFTAPTDATYFFSASVKNVGDNIIPSALYLDLAVPEPSTWAMMLLGFSLIGVSMRRRRNVQVSFA